MNIIFPPAPNNEAAHKELRQFMQQRKHLSIELSTEPIAWIATSKSTRLLYRLNTASWQWILRYLKEGDDEDFGVFPSMTTTDDGDFQLNALYSLVEDKCNIAKMPFLRETQPYVRLMGIFDYGNVFFRFKTSTELLDYLHANKL